MTRDESYIGTDAIDDRIEEQGLKTERLRTLKGTLENTKESTYVYVEVRPDSPMIHVILKADEVTDTMKHVAKMDKYFKSAESKPDEIQYNIEEEKFTLDKKFSTDR